MTNRGGGEVTTSVTAAGGGQGTDDSGNSSRLASLSLPATIGSPEDALAHEQMGRLHAWSRMIVGLSLAGCALVPLVRGDPLAGKMFMGGLVFVASSFGWLWWSTGSPQRYNEAAVAWVSQLQGIASLTALFYFGLFSPYPAIVAVGIYVYALSNSVRDALANYANLAIGQGALAVLIIGGFVDDRGLIRASGLPDREQIVVQLCVQAVFLIALLLGRMSRANTLSVMTLLETAVREVAQRDALLTEARHEIDRATVPGMAGQYTNQVVGSFQLGTVIGRGAMGEIYSALHTTTADPAAVKLLKRNALADQAQLARFLRESRIAASLSVPNVVKVLEIGGADAPVPYLAMEFLAGRDLAQHLRERRLLSIGAVIDLVRQVSAGLEAAREAGIVHRDLKPHNLFLTELSDGLRMWKILDFGVSKLSDGGGTLTAGEAVGTPAYMAPEQASGADVDHRADLYSLGVIAYRCLTGHPAFSGKQIPEVLNAVMRRMPTRPTTLRPQLARDLDSVLAVAMAKEPADRFQSTGELADALETAAENRLDPRIRRKAAMLLAERPWGTRL